MLTRSPRASRRVRVTTRLQFAVVAVLVLAGLTTSCTPSQVHEAAAAVGVTLTDPQAQAVADHHNASQATLASYTTSDPAAVTPEQAKAIAWTALVVEQQKAANAGPTTCHDGVCPTPAQWAALRKCESGNNPAAISTSGKYRGYYQFDQRTWNGTSAVVRLGYVGVSPAAAPPHVQHAAAADLYQARGWRPWPQCGRNLR